MEIGLIVRIKLSLEKKKFEFLSYTIIFLGPKQQNPKIQTLNATIFSTIKILNKKQPKPNIRANKFLTWVSPE